MIKNFWEKYDDFDALVLKWKECITTTIEYLNSKFDLPSKDIFECFKLAKYGFNPEDFGATAVGDTEDLSE